MSDTTTVALERQSKADAITKRRTIYAAGAGLIPFPVLDLATLLGIQVVMIRDLAEVYEMEESFNENKAKHLIHSLVGSLGVSGVLSGVKAIPVVGSIVGMIGSPLNGAAATYALGKVFTKHFDHGGTLLDFDPAASRDYFEKEFEEGKSVAKKAQPSK